ncbi:hypothetical protein AA0112_g8121 [Alternaria arborescens]|uniref:hypothetical protein n=1 Tax=Alternaria arborescens TaxID=156630 RepID=UPI0010754305|nr:hypothetical protein AA0111_g9557 [Alternaria arborescens]RYN26908.1 hypothetical protein AA0112_g8121 [Alternaria arborescens]RYO21738.1 hypothetical protein AA0111_g9557 [Alternaria arborescens]
MAANCKITSANHNPWFLDPVMIELQSCPVVGAEEIAELMVPARMRFLDSSSGTVVREFKKGYGPSKWNCSTIPTLHDTGARRLHPRSLSKILKMDQSWIGDAQFYPPLIPPLCLPLLSQADREATVERLLEHLDNPQYTEYATTLTSRSSAVDRCLRHFVGGNETSSTLPQLSADITSIMHCGALLPLEVSALTSSSTIHLITGVRVYIVYPPTPHNMATMHKYLLDLTEDPAPKRASVCNDLQEGITFVQRAGQTATIPPFCPTMIFSTTTSAGVIVRSRCHNEVSMRLTRLELIVAQIRAVQHVCRETADTSLEYHTVQLYKDISTVFRASEPSSSGWRRTLALGAAWQDNHTRFRALIEGHVSQPLKDKILKNVPRLWNFAVQNQDFEECPVCNVDLKDLGMAFIAHFRKEHWIEAEDNTQ